MSTEVSELSKVRPKGFTLEIGGQERPLRFGFAAAAVLQERFGSLSKALSGLSEVDTNIKVTTDILFALLSIDRTVTIEQVEEWVWELENILEVVTKIKAVLNDHAPVASGDPTSPTGK